MELEKIDLFKDFISTYDIKGEQLKVLSYIPEYDIFINEFSDTQDLLTINISQPIKRILKFYSIDMGIPKSFVELNYFDMTDEQKLIIDNYIVQIKNNL
jgi:hypothetical protein